MAKLNSAERVSREASDNFVFQRSLLAYHFAAERISGDVLEIGTGSGYGVEIIAPKTSHFTTLDKHRPADDVIDFENVTFIQSSIPPIPLTDNSFDFVVSFQVIEHIARDKDFVAEVHRLLRPNGEFIVSTPNAPMSLTRNPWHVREYHPEELQELLLTCFSSVEALGVSGNERTMEYYSKNREGVRRIKRFDPLNLEHRLPRWALQLPYDILNRMNRRRLLRENSGLTSTITMADYKVSKELDNAFDLIYIAKR